jgi:pSer/pThr/pTyr-binding forkhead associated (FHA) protein
VLTCGRARENDLILNHDDVSRAHARLERGLSGYLVTDLGSSNGTFLNDEPLVPHQGRLLKDGDRLTIGPYTLTFRREAPATQPAEADGGSDVQRASR